MANALLDDRTRPVSAQAALPVRPDFFIIGAMKCGTTSMHQLLAAHPGIYLPPGEVHLFAMDEFEQIPQMFGGVNGEWAYRRFEQNLDLVSQRYRELFAPAAPGQILGEDSTTYLPSRRAVERLATYAPAARLIVILRDPVARVYSQYWHWVRTFRAIYSLEETLRFQHGNLLQRSYYEEQLRHVYTLFPADQVKVVIFEEFVRDPVGTARDVARFVGVTSPEEIVARKQHANPGVYPRRPLLALWRNRVLRDRFGVRYRSHAASERAPAGEPYSRAVRRAWSIAVGTSNKIPVPMDERTRSFLAAYLRDRNAGLPELLGRALDRVWPTFDQGSSAPGAAVRHS